MSKEAKIIPFPVIPRPENIIPISKPQPAKIIDLFDYKRRKQIKIIK